MDRAEELIGDLNTFPCIEAGDFGNVELSSRYKVCASSLRSVKKFMSSSLLMRGFALMFGLWPGRHRVLAVFALTFLLPDGYRVMESVVLLYVCPSLQNTNSNTNFDLLFCGNDTQNTSSSNVSTVGLRRITTNFPGSAIFFMKFILPPLSHLTFLWSVWVSSKKDDVIRPSHICRLVKPKQWLKHNCTIIMFFFAMLLSVLWLIISNIAGSALYLVSCAIYAITLWASLLTCWVFGAYTSSLETMTSHLESDIITSDDLDEIIKLHQEMCKVMSATSNAFNIWFMVHWAMYIVWCVVWVSNVVLYYKIVSQSASAFLSGTVYLFIYVYVFIYPCYCAASVTTKCQKMLADFNMKYNYEWGETHPFRQRQQLHVFLKYASYADCGYKVGSITFSSMSVFFSTLLATIGVGLKIFL